MPRIAPPHDDPDWNRLELERMILRKKLDTAAENHRKLAAEIQENSTTLPPSDLLQSMAMAKERDDLPTRTEERILRRKQRGELVILVVLICTALALVWWGLQIQKGG